MDLLKSIFKGDKVIWIIFSSSSVSSPLRKCSVLPVRSLTRVATTGAYHPAQHYPNGGCCNCGSHAQHSLQMVPGVSRLSATGFCHTVGAGHDDGTHQWCGALDDIHGHTVPTFGDCKNGGYHCHSLHPFQGARRRRSPSKRHLKGL